MDLLHETTLSRRAFFRRALAGGALALACPLLTPGPAWGRIPPQEVSGQLSVFNLHTSESLRVRYLEKNRKWSTHGLSRLNHIFRCHYTGAVKAIDPSLFLLLDSIHTRLGGGKRPIQLVSGYRSPEYNRLLGSQGNGVGKRSYHLKGMAADIRIPGIQLRRLRDEALKLRQGGVGLYSEFVHVDIGPVRRW